MARGWQTGAEQSGLSELGNRHGWKTVFHKSVTIYKA